VYWSRIRTAARTLVQAPVSPRWAVVGRWVVRRCSVACRQAGQRCPAGMSVRWVVQGLGGMGVPSKGGWQARSAPCGVRCARAGGPESGCAKAPLSPFEGVRGYTVCDGTRPVTLCQRSLVFGVSRYPAMDDR
jgi:hypothetical protein